jgi:CheY-like chemotaxis protein
MRWSWKKLGKSHPRPKWLKIDHKNLINKIFIKTLLHFNVKKKQESSSSTSFSSIAKNTPINNNRLIPIDILSVDKHSRLTLTKKFKKIIPLSPEDKIIVYQDEYTKNIILKVQEDKKIVDNWVLIRIKDRLNKSNAEICPDDYNDNIINKLQGNKFNVNEKTITDSYLNNKKEDSIGYKLQNNENPLFDIPILLVEDEEDLLLTFTSFLKSDGYNNIKTFSDSRNVLKYFSGLQSSSFFRLAIMDIRMPYINGIQLYQILKILNPSMKTLFITSLDAVNELTSIFSEIKNRDIIRKPINRDQFVKIVNDKVYSIKTN